MQISVDSWPKRLRHVRDFWNEGHPNIGEIVSLSDAAPGDVMIIRKIITVSGERKLFPCHMAIISKVENNSPAQVIHATLMQESKPGPLSIVRDMVEPWHLDRLSGIISMDTDKIFSLVATEQTIK